MSFKEFLKELKIADIRKNINVNIDNLEIAQTNSNKSW
jgi:hypothetical protein